MSSARPKPTKLREKPCVSCGRSMQWRKAWERNWDEVKYCSDACRRSKISTGDHALEDVIMTLLQQRTGGQTICPSEAARLVGGEEWEGLMEPTRRAGRRLVAKGLVEITQRGRVVDPSSFRGPVRFRLIDHAKGGPTGEA